MRLAHLFLWGRKCKGFIIQISSSSLGEGSWDAKGPRDRLLLWCCYSVIKSYLTLWDLMDCSSQAFRSFTISQNLLKLLSIDLVMPSNHFILCCPLLLPSISPSIRVFSNELALCIRWPKYWSFSFSISPSNEYSRSIFFRIYWFNLVAVQGTLKSLLQQHNLNASILQCSELKDTVMYIPWGFPGSSVVKNSPANEGYACSVPGLGGCPEEGNDNSLQYSCLENPMDRGAWQAPGHGIAKT